MAIAKSLALNSSILSRPIIKKKIIKVLLD